MDVESLAKQLILQNMTPEQQTAVLESVRATLQEARGNQKRRVSENVGMVVDALKKIEADIRAKYDDLGQKITDRVNSIQDGRDGINGSDGRDGKDGKDGRPGRDGKDGRDGMQGAAGVPGEDGVSVTDAKIDFDGSLVISLSNGREINVGEVVAPDLAERIKVITNGGGTSQAVLDTLASLQTQINNLIPSQTGNAGKFLTTNGSVLSWAQVAGGLSYQGTWNASTNTPTLASGVGTNGYYYVVSVDGSTNLDGITDWKAGDWLLFNGTVWQKIDQSWAIAGANDNITSMTGITGGISSPDFIQFDTGATVTSAVGRLFYDSGDGSLSVGLKGGNLDLQIGQENVVLAYNASGSTLTAGQVVAVNGAQGQRPSVILADASTEALSAPTLGIVAENIASGAEGFICTFGLVRGIDTSAFTAGNPVYLSETAGAFTATRPPAPAHTVFLGWVLKVNASSGELFVNINNGWELDELHNVLISGAASGNTLIYDASVGVWKNANLTDGNGISITEGAGTITITNSGVRTAQAGDGISVSGTNDITITNTGVRTIQAGTGISISGTNDITVTNSAPDQTVALTGAGTTSISGTYPNFTITSNDQYTGTVTSVGGTGTVNGISLSGTVTSSGSLTLGGTLSGVSLSTQVTGTLPIANGGTGQTTATAAFNALAPSQTGNSGKYLTTNGTNTSWATVSSTGTVTSVAATVPAFLSVSGSPITTSGTLAISYSGTALPIANGGTGQTTAQAAMNSFAGAVTSGQYLRGNGTNVVMSAIQASDVPTLNQNTTGSAATVTGNATGSTFGFNSGYGSVATAYGCRAWVNFNGTGTVAIRASGNVSSITDNGTGDYTVNFTTAMPDANYAVNAISQQGSGDAAPNGVVALKNAATITTSAVRLIVGTPTVGANDRDYVFVSIFR